MAIPAIEGPTKVLPFSSEWQVTQPGDPADLMTGSLNSFLPASALPPAAAAGWLSPPAGFAAPPPPHAAKAAIRTINTTEIKIAPSSEKRLYPYE